MNAVRHIHVTCAIIEKDGLVLAAQRSAITTLPLKWEFPGGKIDPGESTEECLRRELVEELGIEVSVTEILPAVTYRYPALTVTLYPFICAISAGTVVLHEHAAVVWLSAEELPTLDWAAADLPVLEEYLGRRGDL